MAQLDVRKRAAVAVEDYDVAKKIKADMDNLHTAGQQATGIKPLPHGPTANGHL